VPLSRPPSSLPLHAALPTSAERGTAAVAGLAVPGWTVAGLARCRLAVSRLSRAVARLAVPRLGGGAVPRLAISWLAGSRLAWLRCTVPRLPLLVARLALSVAARWSGRTRVAWRVLCVGIPGRRHGRTLRLAGSHRHFA